MGVLVHAAAVRPVPYVARLSTFTWNSSPRIVLPFMAFTTVAATGPATSTIDALGGPPPAGLLDFAMPCRQLHPRHHGPRPLAGEKSYSGRWTARPVLALRCTASVHSM